MKKRQSRRIERRNPDAGHRAPRKIPRHACLPFRGFIRRGTSMRWLRWVW